MLLNGGELDGVRLLAKESVQELERNHIGDLDIDPMPSNGAHKSNRVDSYPGMPKKWSLGGLMNTEDSPGRRNGPGAACSTPTSGSMQRTARRA
jgi:methyl acetate hydrolase